jgi:hypothetical protein
MPPSLFKANKSQPKFSNDKGFVGGVPENTETSAVKYPAGATLNQRGSGVRSFLS